MVKVYFGCSMRGGFGTVSQDDLRKLQGSVKELGHELVTEHQTSQTFETDEAQKQIQKFTTEIMVIC